MPEGRRVAVRIEDQADDVLRRHVLAGNAGSRPEHPRGPRVPLPAGADDAGRFCSQPVLGAPAGVETVIPGAVRTGPGTVLLRFRLGPGGICPAPGRLPAPGRTSSGPRRA